MNKNNKKKVLVCGSRFGQFYLEALLGMENETENTIGMKIEIAGLLARGSQRTLSCVKHYKLKHYKDVEELPEDIDLACVAVSAGVFGGVGTELAVSLMEKGIHVIMEQPVSKEEIEHCMRVALKNKVHFVLGNLYPNLPSVHSFKLAFRKMLEKQRLDFIHIDCSTQIMFPLFEILGDVLPSMRPYKVIQSMDTNGPTKVLQMDINGTPVLIRAYNGVNKRVSDNYLYHFAKISIGASGGTLLLEDCHGDVLWHHRMAMPDGDLIPSSLQSAPPENMRHDHIEKMYSNSMPSYQEIFTEIWPNAIRKDVNFLLSLMDGSATRSAALSRIQKNALHAGLWQEAMKAIGYPVEVENNYEYMPFGTLKFQGGAKAEKAVNQCQIHQSVNDMNRACYETMLNVFHENGLFRKPSSQYTFDEIAWATSAKAAFRPIIKRWVRALSYCGYLKEENERYTAVCQPISASALRRSWERARKSWLEIHGPVEVMDYFEESANQIFKVLDGSAKPNHILFPEGRMDYANALYSATPIALYLNACIADVIEGKLKDSTSLQVLEVGAGTGATTRMIMERIPRVSKEAKGLTYHFTDLSQFFLLEAKKRWSDRAFMKYSLADIETPLDQQGFSRGSLDVVIAAGVVNNAKNILKTLEYFKSVLKKGGLILMSEAVDESNEMLISQAFMMEFTDDERHKQNLTFMSEKNWMKLIEKAGLKLKALKPEQTHALTGYKQKLFLLEKVDD